MAYIHPDAEYNDLVCIRPLGYPRAVPFRNEATFSVGKAIQQFLPLLEQANYYPEKFMGEMGELAKIRDEYFNQNDRVSRLAFLTKYLRHSTRVCLGSWSQAIWSV